MTFEQIQAQWANFDHRLEHTLRLNRQILRTSIEVRIRGRLGRLAVWLLLEAGACLLALLWTGSFAWSHRQEPGFLAPAIALHAWLAAAFAACLWQLVQVRSIDYTEPVAGLQRRLAALRKSSILSVQWALLTGQLVWWTPLLIVASKGLLGVDLYSVLPAHYLIVSAAVGVALMPVLWFSARSLSRHPKTAPALRAFARALAGSQLAEVERELEQLAEWQTGADR